MDLNLSNEQKQIAKLARDFAQKEIYSKIKTLDKEEKFDPVIFKKMADAGFLGLVIPEKYGGQGLDYISLGLLSLELEKIDSMARFIILVHLGLNSLTLLKFATEEQKNKYLTPQAKGEKIAGFALAEPNAGSDFSGIETHAKKDSNFYILNGEKTWITLANQGDNFLIFAITDKSKKQDGISCFIVERNTPGFSSSPLKGKLGMRAGDTGSISLNDVKVPSKNLLGNEGDGYKIALFALTNGLYTVASGAVGIIEACLDESIKYAKERETFGKEIGRHELVQEMIAKMVSAKEIGRLLMYHVGYLKNNNKPSTRETFLTKWINCDNAFKSADDALQIFGAYGYSNEFNIERYWRNARGGLIYGLTREVHTIFQADYALGYKDESF